MEDSSFNSNGIPLRCGPDLVGHVLVTQSGPMRVSGVLKPGTAFEKYRPLFERVREAYKRVDDSSSEEYLEARHNWDEALKAVDRLGLRFGEPGVAIEEFEMDLHWQVGFDLEGWWLPDCKE